MVDKDVWDTDKAYDGCEKSMKLIHECLELNDIKHQDKLNATINYLYTILVQMKGIEREDIDAIFNPFAALLQLMVMKAANELGFNAKDTQSDK